MGEENKDKTKEAPKPVASEKKGQTVYLLEGPGKGMKRAEYIRQEFKKGRTRGEIAKELGIVYQIIFAATKEPKKKEDEKANDTAGSKAPEGKPQTAPAA